MADARKGPEDSRDDGQCVPHFVSPTEFARLTGLSLTTVRRYLADGRLPKIQPGGAGYRILIPRAAIRQLASATAIPISQHPDHLGSEPSTTSDLPSGNRGPLPKWQNRRN